MSQPVVNIPRPCAVSWDALTPTAAGHHCAKCQTEVIDFTRLTQAEIIDYLATRKGQRVCAVLAAPVMPTHPKRPKGFRRWLLTAAVLLGWQSASALGLSPQLLPQVSVPTKHPRIIIRGAVLDDSLNVPLKGAYVFIKDTKYGAVTNEQGEFTLSFSARWGLARKGALTLAISAGHFDFRSQEVVVHFADNTNPSPLIVRLLSIPNRGRIVGKIRLVKPPTLPPGSLKDAH